MTNLTYEESVQWLRQQSERTELVKLCYLDVDNLAAAKRFAVSDEFIAVKKLLRLDNQLEPLKILDLGCGNGIASYAFASLGHNVIATDPDSSSDVGLEATKRLNIGAYNGSISTVQAFAEALPFDDATFDIVYARQALHHFSDLYQGLAECSRVLKPNGLFLATREHVVTDERQLQQFLDNHILHQLHGGENAHTLDVYIEALRQAAFQKIKVLKTFDSVVNHFPMSNLDLRKLLFKSLTNKFGEKAAFVLSRFSFAEKIYRYRLSQSCNSPGRLYSFRCYK
ncbi:class I SAM-dependent methyltransferase [Nodosilinea nodulosa]|uniref:class I SAM-dependent methyltransferase n=1 Tax=Nodosilinea nodulosa TaxID=416001 RepID=UPI0008FB19ED|nr:class I SAM-dependent methyltransferase [Nodosilinea nodulosa]